MEYAFPHIKKSTLSMPRLCIISFVIFCLSCIYTASADAPALKWNMLLTDGGSNQKRGLRKGNGIILSKDGSQLWCISDDGHLFVLNAENGEIIHHVTPDEVRSQVASDSIIWTESRSSVSIHYNSTRNDEISFAVYALTEIKPNNEKTRIVAVHADGSLWWSHTENGIAEGTPIISSDGSRIILNLNTFESDNIQNPTRKGHSLVLDILNWFRYNEDSFDHYPFGEAAYSEANGMIYWSDPWRFGYGNRGILYFRNYMENSVKQLAELNFASVSAPTISESGDQIWLSGSKSKLDAWRSNNINNEDFISNWTIDLKRDGRNETSPLLYSPVHMTDQNLLLTSASTVAYGISASDGEILWERENGRSTFITKPVLSIGDEMVYFIQNRRGNIEKLHAINGTKYWSWNCVDLTDDEHCEDNVEADAVVSRDGKVLYYGDIFGHIVAIQLKVNPTTISPSNTPSIHPSSSSSSLQPTTLSSMSPSISSSSPTLNLSPSQHNIISDKPTLSPNSPTNQVTDSPATTIIIPDGDNNESIQHTSSVVSSDSHTHLLPWKTKSIVMIISLLLLQFGYS